MQNKKYKSIELKSFLLVVLAFAIGVGLYFTLSTAGEYCFDRFYYTEERDAKIVGAYVDNFQEYVIENKVKSTNIKAIQNWCKDNKNIYFMLFDDENLKTIVDGDNIYEYTDGEGSTTDGYTLYPIKFSDGKYNISIIEYSEGKIYTAVSISSIVIAFCVAFFIILSYFLKLIKRIKNISSETKRVSMNINYSVSADKNDEIGDLYSHIEDMRKDIIFHYEKQKETEFANRELITNMSHDIRTPLTAIIGFNEMMNKENISVEEMRQYASYSLQKANQLKDMSDKLFKYFLVYDKDSIEINTEIVPMILLLEQIVAEKVQLLKIDGFDIEFDNNIEEIEISVDPMQLNRVFDNVFSNISKYADKCDPIHISTIASDNKFSVIIKNAIMQNKDNSLSTNIGIKSCKNIMNAMNGVFDSYVMDDIYISVVTLRL